MTAESKIELPALQQYSHSLKIEDTQKGCRFTVHVYANSSDVTIDEAFSLYEGAIKRAARLSIPMADQNGGDKLK